jgi:hypothetical protein
MTANTKLKKKRIEVALPSKRSNCFHPYNEKLAEKTRHSVTGLLREFTDD